MELFYTKSSPYANCVRMVISELGIESAVQLIESHPFDNDAAFIAANPLGKVPCLIEHGEHILDSEVICDYLDGNFAEGALFNPIYADWRLKSLYSVCSGLIDTLVDRRMEFMRESEGIKSEFWWRRQTEAVNRTLGYVESKLDLIPEEFTILHINLMSALMYIDFRHSDIHWREEYPGLRAFFELNQARACFTKNPLE
ncbi:glutathione S-transferase [Aliikangiella marina]|uniref:Glutathione S-transferase n=1 Tax=Aliikangiella marina TaxID=1712262 RepID=A0A545T127_9GAMM|nr:glutathione S-transferase family protein [Aliikangiella marina]TQV70918.1 glutathione S-transferase [Aliikangiella marina]